MDNGTFQYVGIKWITDKRDAVKGGQNSNVSIPDGLSHEKDGHKDGHSRQVSGQDSFWEPSDDDQFYVYKWYSYKWKVVQVNTTGS